MKFLISSLLLLFVKSNIHSQNLPLRFKHDLKGLLNWTIDRDEIITARWNEHIRKFGHDNGKLPDIIAVRDSIQFYRGIQEGIIFLLKYNTVIPDKQKK